MEAPCVRVPAADAEQVRRRLQADGTLRTDLKVARDDGHVMFPVMEGPDRFDFEVQRPSVRHYTELLDAAPEMVVAAPRAFDRMGDIVVVKVPAPWTERAADLGQALRTFTAARAVFHDDGVTGPFRVRALRRIAGEGGSATVVQEHGIRVHVDPAAAYFSPRLADERGRIAAMMRPGIRLIDLFGGVAALGVLAAKRGAEVTSIDLNPAAIALARINAEANGASLDVREGDARVLAADLSPADHVVMNLPHEAKTFLDVGAGLVRPGGVLHHHEILEDADLGARQQAVEAGLVEQGWSSATIENVRHVRAYSATSSHVCMDVRRGT